MNIGNIASASKRVARMREVLTPNLTDSCTIKRPGSKTSDGRGGSTETYATAATADCHFEEPQGREAIEAEYAGQLKGRQPFYVHLEALTDIRYTDRIVHSSIEYEVIDILAPISMEPIRRIVVAVA